MPMCSFMAGYAQHRQLGGGFAQPVLASTGVNGLIGVGLYMNIHKLLMALIY